MKAVVQQVYGSAGVLALREVDRPVVGGGEVLVRVRAAGVDPSVWHLNLVIDTAGNRRLSLLRRAMARHGTLVLVGGEHGRGRLLGGFGRQLRAPLVSVFVGQRLRGLVAKDRAADLEALTRLIESGAVTPVIDRVYPLTDAPDAIRYLAQGHAAGKVVVTI
jgi:NADPH:quinone reductase-like Zn-dependent oxidoreductase